MNTNIYFSILVSLFLASNIFAAPGGPSLTQERPEAPGKMPFENFEVLIVTGHDKDGLARSPYLIITEQRFVGELQILDASLTSETLRVLKSGLLVNTTSIIQVGNHKVTVIRKIYEFTPPTKRYVLNTSNFNHLKDSIPFRGLIIGTDGKEIDGYVAPPNE